jgi:hypothetical protein
MTHSGRRRVSHAPGAAAIGKTSQLRRSVEMQRNPTYILGLSRKERSVFEKQDRYTPAEAERAFAQLEQSVTKKELTRRQAGAHRRYISGRIRVALKPEYTSRAAKRAKTEISRLTEAGTISARSAAAYRAHITKRTHCM